MPSFALADWTSFALFFFALSVVCSLEAAWIC
jgi:hypothetical protein